MIRCHGDSFPINQFLIEGYQQFRVDRSCHGGVLLFYISNNIPAKEDKKHIIPRDIEIINIEINLWKRRFFLNQ